VTRYFLALLIPFAVLSSSAGAQTPSTSAPASSKFDSLAKRAAEARDADRLDDAAALYQQALALRPKWAEGWFSLGMLQYDRNQYAPAAKAFRQLLPIAPKDGTAHVMLGLCEFELGQDDAALKHIEEGKSLGVATNPQLRHVAIYHEGVLLRRKGRFESAQTALGQLCVDGVQSPGLYIDMGQVVLRDRSVEPPAPGSPELEIIGRVGHAACIAAQKKFDEARAEYEAVIAQHADYPNIHYAYGRFLADVNDTAGAVAQFKIEIANHPENVVARLEIAAAEYKTDSAAGLPYAREAVKLDPALPFGHYLLGLLYLDTDDYTQAIPELEIARKAFPNEPKIYFALGSAYSRAGRKQDAEQARAEFQKLTQSHATVTKPGYN
jgi:tetratricopeptide (TPR) repeat protein